MKIVKKFKADIVLITGNNEERIIKNEFDDDYEKFRNAMLSCGFSDVKKEDFISFGKNNYYLNHYPVNHKDNYVNLFGHTHRATGLYKPYGFNVGCDLNHFDLHSEKDIESLVKEKAKFWDNDKNVNEF